MTSRRWKGPLRLLWLFCCAARALHAAMVKRNVTLTGVSYDWTEAELKKFWNATVVSTGALQTGVTECPAGRFCPAGSKAPLWCQLGTYSALKRQSSQCAFQCAPNWYCPDPSTALRCPNQTVSERGSRSQLQCRCVEGYQCTYKKVINVNLGLAVPYRRWTGQDGEALKQKLIQVVADSAGVPVGSVKLVKVLPAVTGQAQGRRLLEARDESALISLSVEGAEALEGLRERLAKAAVFSKKSARVHWKLSEQLRVVAAPLNIVT